VSKVAEVLVRPLVEADLDEADRVCRVAFGTFLGSPTPEDVFGDASLVRTRWQADPSGALVAVIDGQVVGSSFAANWGSVGVFGPLSVAPEYWDRAIGRRLLDATMDIFAGWNTRHAGLFTFAQSAKHVGLYQKFGFWPRFLTSFMSRPVGGTAATASWSKLSELPDNERPTVIHGIRTLTDAVYPGLDLGREIHAVLEQRLGDVVLIGGEAEPRAFAICHAGAGTEAGSGSCFIKFGAARPGPDSGRDFGLLIEACDAFGAERGASDLVAGANAGRDRAWRALAERGFRREFQGVAMHRPNENGYNVSDSYVIDDWR
jgi:GNAT superfamily N-acetyltransferase